MRRHDRERAKPGCRKPGPHASSTALLLCMALLLVLLPALNPARALARETGEILEVDTPAGGEGLLPYRPGEVLVRFSSGDVGARVAAFLEGAGLAGVMEEVFREGEEVLALLELDEGVPVEGAVRLLSPLAGIIYAEPNYIAHAAYTPADPGYPNQWGMNNSVTPGADIDAPGAWDMERGFSDPVTVAVIDTGVDATHPDLDGKIWDNAGDIPGNGADDDGNGYADDAAGFNWAGITQSLYGYYDSAEGREYWTIRYMGYSDYPGRRCAQSILGTGRQLTHVGLILQKEGSPAQDVKVSLRDTRDGVDRAAITITPGEVDTYNGILNPLYSEIYKPLSTPVMLEAGTVYYLVVETANNSSSDFYYLFENRGTPDPNTDQYDPYRDGHDSIWQKSAWEDFPDNDLYFRTNPNASPRDDNGHGTHVSGIAGAEEGNGEGGVGVSFGAKIMPLKVLDCSGSGSYAGIVAAIRYAADNGAEVINISLGGEFYSQALQDAVDYAHGAGAAILAASGNSGDSTMHYPAGCGNVIGVGATTNTDVIAGFSTHNSSVDLSAPGLGIYSTMPTYPVALNSWEYAQGYDYLSGTSMATPMAAGLAALVRSAEPRYGPAQVEQWMEQSADDLGSPGRDDYFGYGRINAYRTLTEMPPFPEVNGLAPTYGEVGTPVTVGGSAFGPSRGSSYVSFGGVQAAQYVSWSDTVVVCRVPAGASGKTQVTVTTPAGTSNAVPFGVTPRVDGTSPSYGPVGAQVTIEGSAFGPSRGSSYVSFGGVPATLYGSWSDTAIVCRVPAAMLGESEVRVTTPGGTSGGVPFGITAPALTWYLAEGSTAGGMETFILVQNPGDAPAQVTLSFLTAEGERPGPGATLAPGTRRTFKANDYVNSYDVSTRVESDQPVVAERAMYGNSRAWAHGSIGITAPAPTWYLAEGSTAGGMETFILVQNPGDAPAQVTLSFLTAEGERPGPGATLAPGTRRTFKANDYVNSYDVSTRVESDQPVVAERAMYGNSRAWAHGSIGITAPAPTWYLAEGSTAGGMETFILVQNPGDAPAQVTLSFLTAEGERPGPGATLAPGTRRTFKANDYVNSYDVSTRVESDQPVVAERAMYGNSRAWAHGSIGITAPAPTWYLAEGSTAGGMETFILVQNPGDAPAQVTLSFLTAEGERPGPGATLAPGTRRTFKANDYVNSYDVSTRVESDQPVVAERAMYGNSRAWAHGSIGVFP